MNIESEYDKQLHRVATEFMGWEAEYPNDVFIHYSDPRDKEKLLPRLRLIKKDDYLYPKDIFNPSHFESQFEELLARIATLGWSFGYRIYHDFKTDNIQHLCTIFVKGSPANTRVLSVSDADEVGRPKGELLISVICKALDLLKKWGVQIYFDPVEEKWTIIKPIQVNIENE
jgi:hypothetical protein